MICDCCLRARAPASARSTCPPVQAGSSIMPGKVNPVIPEVVNQVAFEVMGNDLTITVAAEAGQLQLNAFEPIIARALLSSLSHLTAAVNILGERCIRRNHRQPRTHARGSARFGQHRHRAQPIPRLRGRHRPCRGSDRNRLIHTGIGTTHLRSSTTRSSPTYSAPKTSAGPTIPTDRVTRCQPVTRYFRGRRRWPGRPQRPHALALWSARLQSGKHDRQPGKVVADGDGGDGAPIVGLAVRGHLVEDREPVSPCDQPAHRFVVGRCGVGSFGVTPALASIDSK